MNRERIRYTTTALLYEYSLILSDLFPYVNSLEDFAERFNQLDFKYQGWNKLKLDPEEIRQNKYISCSATTMLMGLWWLLKNEAEPHYFIEEKQYLEHVDAYSGSMEKKKTRAHVVMKTDLKDSMIWEMWDRSINSGRNIIRHGKDNQLFLHPQKHISKTSSLFANRISTFGLQNQMVTKLEKHRTNLGEYVNNYEEYILQLRKTFLGK